MGIERTPFTEHIIYQVRLFVKRIRTFDCIARRRVEIVEISLPDGCDSEHVIKTSKRMIKTSERVIKTGRRVIKNMDQRGKVGLASDPKGFFDIEERSFRSKVHLTLEYDVFQKKPLGSSHERFSPP